MRIATAGALPYIRPDWVREELAKPAERTWPLVAVAQVGGWPTVVPRANIQLGWGRRGHASILTLEEHPDVGDEGSRSVLQEAVHVAED